MDPPRPYPQQIPRPSPGFYEALNPRQIRWPRERIGSWRQSRALRIHDFPEENYHGRNNSPWRDSWVMANTSSQADDPHPRMSSSEGEGASTPISRVAHVGLDRSEAQTISGSDTATEYHEPHYPNDLPPGASTPSPAPEAAGENVVPGDGKGGLGQRPACFSSTLQEISFVAQSTIAMSTTTFLVGATSIVTASIGADLHMTQAEISWIAASTTLAAGAFQLAVGQMADLLGRKLMYLAGMGSFAVFVLILGFAQNPFWMDVLLGVLGISCAMVVPPAGGILGAAYGKPSKRKNLAFAAFSAGNPVGFVFGSITCGIATMLFNVSASLYFIPPPFLVP